ncbi:hypothetical protein U9M48_007568, partial [Paspalum notatum var. saurae]
MAHSPSPARRLTSIPLLPHRGRPCAGFPPTPPSSPMLNGRPPAQASAVLLNSDRDCIFLGVWDKSFDVVRESCC